jgi:hypothetical protein
MTGFHSNETPKLGTPPGPPPVSPAFYKDSDSRNGMARRLLFSVMFMFARAVRESDKRNAQ